MITNTAFISHTLFVQRGPNSNQLPIFLPPPPLYKWYGENWTFAESVNTTADDLMSIRKVPFFTVKSGNYEAPPSVRQHLNHFVISRQLVYLGISLSVHYTKFSLSSRSSPMNMCINVYQDGRISINIWRFFIRRRRQRN